VKGFAVQELTALVLISLVFLAGCPQAGTPQQTPQTPTEPSSDSQPTTGTEPATPTPPAALRENDGSSGGDAPDRFQDGLVELAAGEYTENAIAKPGDLDFYKFTVGAGDWFKATVTPTSELDAQILIYGEGGKESTWDYTYYWVGNTEGDSTFKINSAAAGKEEGFWSQMSSEEKTYTYYFSVGPAEGGGTGNYTIQLEVRPQDDAGTGKDAGETPAKALAIGPGTEHRALLNWNDKVDCFKLSTGGNATVTISPETDLDVSLTLHDHGGKDATWDLTYYKKTNKDKAGFSIDDASAGIPESVTWETTGSMQFVCVKKKGGQGNYTVEYS